MATCTPTPPIAPELLPDIPVSTVNTATVTEGCIDGTGIYDVFMQAHVASIHEEYGKGRIKGIEYSKVYLGGMQTAMGQAVAFALGKDQAAAQTELARYQMLKMAADIELVEQQICLTKTQIEESENKVKLLEIQSMVELAKIHDTPNLAAVDGIEAFRTAANQVGADGVNDIDIASVFGSQIDKTAEEAKLIIQKTETELAQVSDTLLDAGPVEGVVRKEKNLLQRQSDGFLRDAEAKVAKLAVDAFAVQYSTADGLENFDSEFDAENGSIASALRTAIENVGKAEHADSDVDDNATDSPA